ncbi:MAG: hypothetical protein ACO3ZY_08510 [Phycisphaerales bacterium]
MTSPLPRPVRPFRTEVAALAIASLAGGLLVGCGEDPPPPPPVVLAPPPDPGPPPPPPVTPIETLMVQLGIDSRVRLPEAQAPGTDAERIAVLRFCDAFVRGNGDSVRPMLSMPDQFQFDRMVDAGEWPKAVEGVSRVDVRTGRSPEGDACVLAIFHTGLEFQPQLWLTEVRGDEATFDALPTPPDIMNKLSGSDWIAAWFEVNRGEIARADEPDEAVAVPQQDFTEAANVDAGAGSSPGGITPGGAPGAPGVPGRRMPSGTPVAPPTGPLGR